MNALALWFNDLRWAANIMRARRIRRDLIFSQRQKFDIELRPTVPNNTGIISYPDAFYYVEGADLARAIRCAHR